MEFENTTIKTNIKNALGAHEGSIYQTHTWGGEILNKGIRGIERRSSILTSDLKDKFVLDLGCATGSESIWALECGAKGVVGLEAGESQVRTFNKIINSLGDRYKGKAVVHRHNLNNPLPVLPLNIDTIFCFSITHHINYKKIWLEVKGVRVVYVEGGADSNYTEKSLSDKHFNAKFISFVENNSVDKTGKRPLFRLVRKS